MLCPVSHSAGVGIFLGSNALNQVLSSWNKLNAIFSSGIKFPKPAATLPVNPVIVRHNLTELNPLEASPQEATKCAASPSLASIVVNPIRPTNTIRGGLEYIFKKRHILVYKESSDNFNDAALKVAFAREVNNLLSESVPELKMLVENDRLDSLDYKLELFSTMRITLSEEFGVKKVGDSGKAYHSPLGFPLWSKVKAGKFNAGNWLMLAVDYYEITLDTTEGTSRSYVGLTSDIVPFRIRDDEAEVSNSILQLRYTSSMSELITPTAASPKWFAAGSSAVLFPNVVSGVLSFLEMVRQYLHSLLDDALDWLTNLISLLDRTLQYLLRITTLIDGILQLLEDLADLNVTLGASVMTFIGQGDSYALIKEFQEYLDPNVARATSDSEVTPLVRRSEVYSSAVVTDPTDYEARLEKFSEDIALLGRTTPDPLLDGSGSTLSVREQRNEIEKEALRNLRQGKDPKFTSIAAAARTDYNLSPVFTKDMTTCGLILMTHSPSYGRVQAAVNLYRFLFLNEDDAPTETEEESMASSNLSTETPDLYPKQGELLTQSVTTPLFSEDMQVVEEPTLSPFNFCP